jgi:hypothetical protein
MTKLLEEALATGSSLSDETQDELARLLLLFAGVEQEPLRLSEAEKKDLDEADAEIARGEFATDEEVRTLWAIRRE